MDCSLPDSSIHDIFQARILGWVANSFSKCVTYIWVNVNVKVVSISVKLGQSRMNFYCCHFLSPFYYMTFDFFLKMPSVWWFVIYFINNIWFENSSVLYEFYREICFLSSQLLCVGRLAGNFPSDQFCITHKRRGRQCAPTNILMFWG